MLGGIDLRTVSFAEPLFLWLLAAPAMLIVFWSWRVAGRRRDGRRHSRERLSAGRPRFTRFGDLAFWLFLFAAMCLCIAALARPQVQMSAVRRASADIVLLQDGSASMYVKDVQPDRWQRSLKFLRTFADALSWKGDRVALALFAHLASPQVRLTKDPNALFFFLDHLGTQSPFRLEDDPTWDTNIEEAINWGLKIVEKDEQLFGKSTRPKAFVVISDGQDWSANVAAALTSARARGITVHVVGVGTIAGGLIPAPPEPVGPVAPGSGAEGAGAPIRAVLDRESLRRIARAGGGEYFEIGAEPDRSVAVKIIGSVARRANSSGLEKSVQDVYWPLLLGAALFLAAGVVVLSSRAELWWEVAALLAAIGTLAAVL